MRTERYRTTWSS